jgi:hypothetical protein
LPRSLKVHNFFIRVLCQVISSQQPAGDSAKSARQKTRVSSDGWPGPPAGQLGRHDGWLASSDGSPGPPAGQLERYNGWQASFEAERERLSAVLTKSDHRPGQMASTALWLPQIRPGWPATVSSAYVSGNPPSPLFFTC